MGRGGAEICVSMAGCRRGRGGDMGPLQQGKEGWVEADPGRRGHKPSGVAHHYHYHYHLRQ